MTILRFIIRYAKIIIKSYRNLDRILKVKFDAINRRIKSYVDLIIERLLSLH